MAEINFGGQKVQSTGIAKDDFVNQMKAGGVEESKAQSIFDKFNTNNQNESKDVLDKDEQLKVMQFMKTMANGDTTITDEEFSAQSSLAAEKGIESQDVLSKTYDTIKQIIAQDTSDDLEVEYDGNIAKLKVGTTSSTKRVKYDPVHLTDAWRNSRDIANNIDSDKYKDIKTKNNASDVLDAILTAQGITDVSEENKTALLKRLIKFNPSVFNRETGEVWEDANWSKLDFPKGTDINAMISEEADLSGLGEAGTKLSNVNSAETLDDPANVNSSLMSAAVANYNEGKDAAEQLRTTDATDKFGVYCKKSNVKGQSYLQHYIYVNGNMEKVEKFIPGIKSNEHVSGINGDGKVYLVDDKGGSRQINIKYDTATKKFINTETDKSGSQTQNTSDAVSADVAKNDKNISFTNNDKGVATVYESSGWFSGAAHLKISSGKNAGNYKFVCSDGDNLNYGKFKVNAGNNNDHYLSVGNYEVTKLKGTDANGAQREFNVKTNSNGSLLVQVDGAWVSLEQFVAMS